MKVERLCLIRLTITRLFLVVIPFDKFTNLSLLMHERQRVQRLIPDVLHGSGSKELWGDARRYPYFRPRVYVHRGERPDHGPGERLEHRPKYVESDPRLPKN